MNELAHLPKFANGLRTGRTGPAIGEAVVHVLAIRARMGEALETLLALERLLAAVQTLVLRQVVLVLERFRAHVALIRPLTCTSKREEKTIVKHLLLAGK